ncbi:MAG: M48 family metalloprotease [Desulfobacterales bacterium]
MINRLSKFFFFTFGSLLTGLVLGCATPSGPVTAPGSEVLENRTDEQMLWQKSEQEQRVLVSNGLIYQDQALEDYLNRIAVKLQPEPAGLKIRVSVIKDTHLNAFAYPNGMIYINSGLLARMDNEAQLAAVLAHEIAHCTQRHALRAMRMAKDQPAFLRAVQHALSKTKGLQDVARFMGISGAIATFSGHIRELEAEADQVGIELMVEAGYDPREALYIFDQMVSEMEQEGFEEPILGSHPTVGQRVAYLQNLIDTQHPQKGSVTQNSEKFLANLDRLFLNNAELDIQQGRFQLARLLVEKHLRIQPDDSRAYFLLGEIYRQRRQDDDMPKALAYYDRAVRLDPSFAAAYKGIGLIHYKEGRRALAGKFFKSCIQLAPNSPDKAYIQEYLKQCRLSEEG